MIRVHINPRIGEIPLERLRPEDIQKLFNTMSKGDDIAKACAGWTVLKAKNIINNSLEQAVRNRLIQFNPCQATTPPKANQKEIRILSENEQQKLVGALGEHRLRAFFMLALATGMRRGELMALTWNAIDFQNKTVTIRHKVTDAIVDGKLTIIAKDKLKTKSSNRTLPLLPQIEERLLAEKERQKQNRKLCKKSYQQSDYIFVNDLGHPIKPDFVSAHFKYFIEKNGLRHSCASLLLSLGIPMKQIQDWLGHSNFSTTADLYAHLDYSTKLLSGDAISGAFPG